MHPGITLENLLLKITEQNNTKRDYLAEANDIRFVDRDEMGNDEAEGRTANQLTIESLENTVFDINDNCHRQIASRLDIPWKYYNRMANERPELLRDNVNHWLRVS